MPDATGKTIAWIEEQPTDLSGYRRDDTLLIHFTDGTALEVLGSSYEEVSIGYREIDAETRRRMASAAAGRREAERVRELARSEWRSISCEERSERRAAKREKAGASGLVAEQMEQAMILEMVRDSNIMSFGDVLKPQPPIKGFCPHCGERWCENAPDLSADRPSGGLRYVGGTITFPMRDKR